MSHSLFAAVWSCLNVDGCWLIWLYLLRLRWLWQFLKTTMKCAALIDSFINDFSSMRCRLIHFTHSRTSLKIESNISNLLLLYQLSYCNIQNPLLPFKQSSEHFHKINFYFENPLSLLIHRSNSSPMKILWGCSSFITSSGFTSNPSSLAIFTIFSHISTTES